MSSLNSRSALLRWLPADVAALSNFVTGLVFFFPPSLAVGWLKIKLKAVTHCSEATLQNESAHLFFFCWFLSFSWGRTKFFPFRFSCDMSRSLSFSFCMIVCFCSTGIALPFYELELSFILAGLSFEFPDWALASLRMILLLLLLPNILLLLLANCCSALWPVMLILLRLFLSICWLDD